MYWRGILVVRATSPVLSVLSGQCACFHNAGIIYPVQSNLKSRLYLHFSNTMQSLMRSTDTLLGFVQFGLLPGKSSQDCTESNPYNGYVAQWFYCVFCRISSWLSHSSRRIHGEIKIMLKLQQRKIDLWKCLTCLVGFFWGQNSIQIQTSSSNFLSPVLKVYMMQTLQALCAVFPPGQKGDGGKATHKGWPCIWTSTWHSYPLYYFKCKMEWRGILLLPRSVWATSKYWFLSSFVLIQNGSSHVLKQTVLLSDLKAGWTLYCSQIDGVTSKAQWLMTEMQGKH